MSRLTPPVLTGAVLNDAIAATDVIKSLVPDTVGSVISKANSGDIVEVPAGLAGQSLRLKDVGSVSPELNYVNLMVIHLEDVGGLGDGLRVNDTAWTKAISYANTRGAASTNAQGVTIAVSDGAWQIRNPVTLLRQNATPNNIVHIQGTGAYKCVLTAPTFPAGRGMIEWDTTARRVWHNAIRDIGFRLPSTIANVRAIKHTPVNPLTNYTNVSGEFFQCDMQRLYISGTNTNNDVFIDLGIGNRWARMEQIIGDPSIGTGTYDTILIKTPFDYTGGGVGLNDAMGIGFCILENLIIPIRNGGYGTLFYGRTYRSKWSVCTAAGGHVGQSPADFNNSFAGIYDEFSFEGKAEPSQIRVWNGVGMKFTNIGLGTPNPGPGIGISLEGTTRDCYFADRVVDNGNPKFSASGSKVIKIANTCARNVFERIQIRGDGTGDPSSEIQIDAPLSNLNYISGIDLGAGTLGTAYALGSHPHHPSAIASLDFPSIPAQSCVELSMIVGGAQTNDIVELGPPSSLPAGVHASAYVSASNTVTIRLCNVTASATPDIAAATWRATVRRAGA